MKAVLYRGGKRAEGMNGLDENIFSAVSVPQEMNMLRKAKEKNERNRHTEIDMRSWEIRTRYNDSVQ